MNAHLEIRPATADHLREYFGRAMPLEHWFGIAATVEDVVVGVGGIAWLDAESPFGAGAFVFLDCPKRWMPSPLRAHRLARRVLAIAREAGETEIFALPTAGVAIAKKWFAALGFKPERVVNGQEVWACRWPA